MEQTLKKGEHISHWKIKGVLGIGGFGVTYLAQDERLERLVSIKEYLPADMGIRDAATRQVHPRTGSEDNYQFGLEKFLEEAKVLAQFNHPNIVKVQSFEQANNTAYLIMDYEQGQDLGDYLKRTEFKGNMPETELKSYLIPILKGLQAVHDKGLLHRDVKPGNIYLRKDGEPMLIDFGAARYALGEHSKSMSAIISMGYAPPEQYSSKAKQSPASDLYAWGATSYELITGKPPIESPDRSNAIFEDEPDPLKPLSQTHKGKYSDALLSVIDQCLNIPQKKRPQSAKEILAILTGEKTSTGTVKVNPKDRFKNPNKQLETDEGSPIKAGHPDFAQQVGKSYHARRQPKGKTNFLKYAVAFFLATGISLGGYYGYDYYQKQQALTEQKRQAQLIAERKEQKIWQEAINVNSLLTYQNYLNRFPNGRFVDNAKDKIKLLTEKKNLVMEIQNLLLNLDYIIEVNGVLDAKTIESIRKFESNSGLTPIGKASHSVLQQLKEAKSKKEVERLRAKKQEEKERQLILGIQKELKRLKYGDQNLNGLWDQTTKQRATYYQKLKNKKQAAIPTQSLLTSLSKETAWPKEFVCKMVPVYETRDKKADRYYVEASHKSRCPQRGACDPYLLCDHAEEYAEKKLKKECERDEKLVNDYYDCSSSNSSSARVEAEGYCQEKNPGTERVKVGEKEECTKI